MLCPSLGVKIMIVESMIDDIDNIDQYIDAWMRAGSLKLKNIIDISCRQQSKSVQKWSKFEPTYLIADPKFFTGRMNPEWDRYQITQDSSDP